LLFSPSNRLIIIKYSLVTFGNSRNFHGISVVIMVINVVIRGVRVSRPTSCKPRVLYKPILMEDLYMEFILFIYLICFINLLLILQL